MIKSYRFRMKYSEFWRLDPLDTLDDIPELKELKFELDEIIADLRALIREDKGKKGNIHNKYTASLRIQDFKEQLEKNGIALLGFRSFLQVELGVGINLSTMLIKLAFFTSDEIKIIDETIGYQKLVRGRTIPYNYKEIMSKYSKREMSKEAFKHNWSNAPKRVSIKI